MPHSSSNPTAPKKQGGPACPRLELFDSGDQAGNERRTWFVIALTLVTMAAEIAAGMVFGSMALLADGWHMGSHASALGITVLGYHLARKYKNDRNFAFGTGKIGDLAGFSSALLLVFVAILMAYESLHRLLDPVAIGFNQAILVAVVGLAVNLASALILKEPHHGHEHGADHNLRAAYLHVLADALTSILAIAALILGKFFGFTFLDPLMGLVGAAIIARWSYGLILETGRVLLDYEADHTVRDRVLKAVRGHGGPEVEDLHVWRLGPRGYAAIISLRADRSFEPGDLKKALGKISQLVHVTVELTQGNQPGDHRAEPPIAPK